MIIICVIVSPAEWEISLSHKLSWSSNYYYEDVLHSMSWYRDSSFLFSPISWLSKLCLLLNIIRRRRNLVFSPSTRHSFPLLCWIYVLLYLCTFSGKIIWIVRATSSSFYSKISRLRPLSNTVTCASLFSVWLRHISRIPTKAFDSFFANNPFH